MKDCNRPIPASLKSPPKLVALPSRPGDLCGKFKISAPRSLNEPPKVPAAPLKLPPEAPALAPAEAPLKDEEEPLPVRSRKAPLAMAAHPVVSPA